MYKKILKMIKRVLDWMNDLDLSNPKEIPCNQNCINERYIKRKNGKNI